MGEAGGVTLRKSLIVVPEAGVEPAWTFWVRGILSSYFVVQQSRLSSLIVANLCTSPSSGDRFSPFPPDRSR